TVIQLLSLHDALPIYLGGDRGDQCPGQGPLGPPRPEPERVRWSPGRLSSSLTLDPGPGPLAVAGGPGPISCSAEAVRISVQVVSLQSLQMGTGRTCMAAALPCRSFTCDSSAHVSAPLGV